MNKTLHPLPWQQALWLDVTALIAQNRLPHALLLTGPGGVGKRHFAHALMGFLLCEARGEFACGVCRSCSQFLADTHPNAIVLRLLVDEKTGKEKRDISIEQIRDFTTRLQLTAHYAQAKVALIDPVDALNASGANALLKTLEEPPGHAHMLLISERPMALAPTLRSRCQRLRFAVPAQASALAWLQAEHALKDAPATLELANGAPLRALQLKESGLLDNYREWTQIMQALSAQKTDPVSASASIGKDQVAAFLAWLQQWLTGLLRQNLVAQASAASNSAIEQMLRETLEGQRRLGSNANPQMLLESLLILWWRLTRSASAPSR